MTIKSLTLYQYTSLVGQALSCHPELSNAWVEAELSDVRVAGGHCYMELLEKNSSGQTVARLRANIWRNVLVYVNGKFRQATGGNIANGIKVRIRGSVSHHPLYGMSFNIIDIDPAFTMGDMERLRQEILLKLKNLGVLDANRQLRMPMAPQRIAVISAAGAAGYGDFINQLDSTPEGFKFYPVLVEASMQGERTVSSVLAALEWIESRLDYFDCVVLIRGGGSTTDLNGFDNFDLAYRVATFPIPVIVGIGHERDRTVLDEIACVRCKTPTAVAGFLIDSLRQAWTMTQDLVNKAARYASDLLSGEQRRLSQLAITIPAAATQRIENCSLRLLHYVRSLPMIVSSRTTREASRLDSLGKMIGTAAETAVHHQILKLDSTAKLIEVLSPQNTLKRGYSLTRVNGKAVRDASALTGGMEIETLFASGRVKSIVK